MRILPDLKPASARLDHWRMVRRLGLNAAFGACLGIAVGVSLICLDIGGIGSRIARSSTPWLASLILVAPLAFTLGGAVAASFIMLMPYEREFREPERRLQNIEDQPDRQ